MMENQQAGLSKIADDYFTFLVSAYPVMSLSDEFYFFPRASQVNQNLGCLDSLNREKIKQDISFIRSLLRALEGFHTSKMELEARIDREMLKASMQGYLREFQQARIWQSDPNLYLKIIALGIEQIVHKLPMVKKEIRGECIARIRQIPSLLKEAKTNLKRIPPLKQEAAIQLVKAVSGYFKTGLPLFLKARGLQTPELKNLTGKAIQSLQDFQRFLSRKAPGEEIIENKQALQDLLANSFSYQRDLKEIFEIACDEYQRIQRALKKTASQIQPSQTWQEILSGYKLKVSNAKELLKLYAREILGLQNFIRKADLVSLPKMQEVRVCQTPVYLAPIRASASYSCPLSMQKKEAAFFYAEVGSVKENIQQEYIFVTAHETYPGHHLLDTLRRNLKNPIRRQIESPLFYEGWASYAERLIEEFGYLKNPRQRLVGLRRQAWRAVRAKLDVGFRIKKFKLSEAADQLRWLGYRPERIKSMLKHYLLTPGYQLCYTIGKFEIERLRKRFAPRMGIKNFHNCLLSGGEIPFDFIKKRMEKLCKMNF